MVGRHLEQFHSGSSVGGVPSTAQRLREATGRGPRVSGLSFVVFSSLRLREARKKKSTLWVESTGYFTKSFSELEKIIRDFALASRLCLKLPREFQSRDFDSYGAANFCSDPSEDHDKLIEERKGQYKSQRVSGAFLEM